MPSLSLYTQVTMSLRIKKCVFEARQLGMPPVDCQKSITRRNAMQKKLTIPLSCVYCAADWKFVLLRGEWPAANHRLAGLHIHNSSAASSLATQALSTIALYQRVLTRRRRRHILSAKRHSLVGTVRDLPQSRRAASSQLCRFCHNVWIAWNVC